MIQALTKFPIVGIGASAGGVEAPEHLFGPMPTDLGAALVVNTYLAPGKASLLPEISASLPIDGAAVSTVRPVEGDA